MKDNSRHTSFPALKDPFLFVTTTTKPTAFDDDDFLSFGSVLKTPILHKRHTEHNIEEWTLKECARRQPYAPKVAEDLRLEHTFSEMTRAMKELNDKASLKPRKDVLETNRSKQLNDASVQNETKTSNISVIDRIRTFARGAKLFFQTKNRNKVFPEKATMVH